MFENHILQHCELSEQYQYSNKGHLNFRAKNQHLNLAIFTAEVLTLDFLVDFQTLCSTRLGTEILFKVCSF